MRLWGSAGVPNLNVQTSYVISFLQRLGFGLRQLSALRPCKMVRSYLAGLLGMGLDVSSNADYSPPCNLHKSLRGNDCGGRGGRDGPSCGVLWLIALGTDGSPSSSHVCA